MAQIPGMLGDVYWGDPAAPLPNWREHDRPDGDTDNDDDEPLTDDERDQLVGRLGFDPADLAKRFGEGGDDDDDDDSDDGEPPLSKGFRRVQKAASEETGELLKAADAMWAEGKEYP